jgi:aspartyl-tRNA(Asn)/glutamyl-tRNA(Gln) amidotransferase subunit A
LNTTEARQRIEEHRDLNIFISLTDVEGDGPVVAVKDVVDVAGTVTTAGSLILPRVVATEDAAVIKSIRARGGSIVGKTNMHEFAFGVTNENPHFGACLNPRDPTRVPGGSSGGSAAAVAAGMCDWSIGTDTGGSVRIPASLCGVVGMKPTNGMLSSDGIFPLASSLDTPGPLAPDVRMAAQALEWMADIDGLVPVIKPLAKFRIGAARNWVDGLDADTRAAWELVTSGLPDVRLPELSLLTDIFQPIFFCEAAAVHRKWVQERPSSYGPDVLESVERGLKIAGVYYVEAIRARDAAVAEVEWVMRDWDAVLLPTTAIAAPLVGAPHVREPLLRFARPFNLTRQPVVTVPAPAPGLPVGIQVIGHVSEDARILEVAAALESDWRQRTV